MSIMNCTKCERYIDTDFECEGSVGDVFFCIACNENLIWLPFTTAARGETR